MAIKRETLIWIIIILAALNIATIATIVFHYYQSNMSPQSGGISSAEYDERGVQRYNGRSFRDALELDPGQMERFRVINQRFRDEGRSISFKLNQLRQDMLANLESPSPDTSQLNQLSDSLGILHAKLKRVTYRYYLDIQGICRPEQQEKLNLLFESAFRSDHPVGNPESKRGMGKERNRPSNNQPPQ